MKYKPILILILGLLFTACTQIATPLNTLETPQNFEAGALETSILLTWDAVPDATTYVISRKTSEDDFSTLVTLEATDNAYEDITAEVDTAYSYQLIAKNEELQSEAVTVEAMISAPVSTCGPMIQEAEAADLEGGSLIIADDVEGGNASGGKFVHVPDSDQQGGLTFDDMDEPKNIHYIEFCFNVEVSGEYMIKTWVAGFDDSDDSFWVTVNDNEPYLYSFADVRRGSAANAEAFPLFTEDFVRNEGEGDVITNFAAGEHIIRFHYRESDSRLDKVALDFVANSLLY